MLVESVKYLEVARADDKFQVGKYVADPGHPGTPTYFEIRQPLVGYGTESYADNHVVLQRIHEGMKRGQVHISALGAPVAPPWAAQPFMLIFMGLFDMSYY